MNAEWIITAFVTIDDLMKQFNHKSHSQAKASDSEVLLVAVVAAKYFQNHHKLTLSILTQLKYLSGPLSYSRFNRRLHALSDWFELMLATLAELFRRGEVYVMDSMPMPVCRRVRARRCRKVRGKEFCGYCAAKKEKFFGWRLHLITTPEGVPVSFSILPASSHDLTPIHELTYELPSGARVFCDKGYNAQDDEATIELDTGVRLIPIRKVNMENHTWQDRQDLREYRKKIETANSQLEKMGVERLYARTNPGFELKAQASLLALTFTNAA
jgi:hypothetical protein